jgi:hypothetical protein
MACWIDTMFDGRFDPCFLEVFVTRDERNGRMSILARMAILGWLGTIWVVLAVGLSSLL